MVQALGFVGFGVKDAPSAVLGYVGRRSNNTLTPNLRCSAIKERLVSKYCIMDLAVCVPTSLALDGFDIMVRVIR